MTSRESGKRERQIERASRRGDDVRAPELPEGLDLRDLPRGVRAELRGIPKDLADRVGERILAAGLLIDEDPETALAHVLVARRLAARLSIVREAVAETAYAAGDWSTALSEYRTLRRMRGGLEYLPVIADCERAVGRPREALALLDDPEAARLDADAAIELRIVAAGARQDLGQPAEAERVLRRTIGDQALDGRASSGTRARLRYAYAMFLQARGDQLADQWFAAAATVDRDGVTDARARLEGAEVIAFDDSPDEPTDSLEAEGAPDA